MRHVHIASSIVKLQLESTKCPSSTSIGEFHRSSRFQVSSYCKARESVMETFTWNLFFRRVSSVLRESGIVQGMGRPAGGTFVCGTTTQVCFLIVLAYGVTKPP